MKIQIVAVAIVCLLSLSNLKADYPEINICVGIAGNQTNPDIDGNFVVYQDEVDIYWVDLTDPNLVRHQINQGGIQKNAGISGDWIVWQDDRLSSNREIYVYDLGGEPLRVLTDNVHQRNPDISGETIVCEYYNAGFYNVATWNPLTSSYNLVALNAAAQWQLAVDGSIAVWRDDRNGKSQIYRCDLSITPYAASPVCSTAGFQQYPVVSGNIVAWQEVESGQALLKVYDVAQGHLIWTHPVSGAQDNCMSMSGDLLVWQELHSGRTDYDIRGYDFSTGSYLDIATGTQDDKVPSISGRKVVWQRNGTDIVGAEISNPAAIQVTAPNGGEMFLSGSDIEITWQMAQGDAPDSVNLDFSSDNGMHWISVAAEVPFADSFVWESEPIDSQQCVIRVQAADNPQVMDTSAVFTIFQCDTALTADLTGDCFVGMEDVAVLAGQWLTCGNQYDPSWCTD